MKLARQVSDADWKKRHGLGERYNEHDGVYLGSYAQWFVGVFFCFGFFSFCGFIGVLIAWP